MAFWVSFFFLFQFISLARALHWKSFSCWVGKLMKILVHHHYMSFFFIYMQLENISGKTNYICSPTNLSNHSSLLLLGRQLLFLKQRKNRRMTIFHNSLNLIIKDFHSHSKWQIMCLSNVTIIQSITKYEKFFAFTRKRRIGERARSLAFTRMHRRHDGSICCLKTAI